MKDFIVLCKVVLFGCGLIVVFGVASNVIPQAKGFPPVIVDLRYINTVDKMIELGAEIWGSEAEPGRGTCPMCHRRIGGRAPVLDGIAFRANKRVQRA
ncbi:MAG: hypothetical protein V3U15_00690, partial [Nitrospinota bacterium]